MAEPLRVVVLKDGDLYIAQCLEIDIAAQGTNKADAIRRLYETVQAERNLALEEGRDVMNIGPAPRSFHLLYDSNAGSRTELPMVA